MTLKQLGKRVRAVRKNRDLSQLELSLRTGLQSSYIGMMENGHRNPTFKVLNTLANDGFDMSISSMLDDEYVPAEMPSSINKIITYVQQLSEEEREVAYNILRLFFETRK